MFKKKPYDFVVNKKYPNTSAIEGKPSSQNLSKYSRTHHILYTSYLLLLPCYGHHGLLA